MSTQMNKLTAASLKLHMFGVFVLQTLHAEGKLPEDFDPMSLDTSIVAKFDPNEMKNLFKTNKKTKTNVKMVSSPRENVVGVIANNHYESSDVNQTDDVVMQIVNAAKSDVAEKPKRKPRQKKAPVESVDAETTEGFAEPQAAQNLDSLSRIPVGNPTTNESAIDAGTTVQVVVEEKPKKKAAPKKKAVPAEPVVAESTEPVDAASTSESVASEEKPKKKAAPKKKAVPAEPVVAESTEPVDAASTSESVAAEEKPKKKAAPKKKAVPAEPVVTESTKPVVAETTEPVVVAEEKPKKKSTPKKKTAPAEPVVAETTEPVVVVEEKPKKTAAIKAVKDLISSVVAEKKEEIIEEPVEENKVEETNVVEEDEEEEEIQARIMNYEGKQYLIDDKKTVYDKESFDELGTFDEDTQKIIFN